MFKKIFSLFAALTLSVGLWAAAPANVESVDLGLPSGLKWATFNVGATAPEGNGDYFAWGETEPYYADPTTDPITWKTGKETGYSWQSYCGSSSFDEWSTAPYDATTKNLKPEFDAATANWGSDWRMPTKEELDELKNNCTWTWTANYNSTGIKGYVITSKAEGNTNSIFLPTSGCRDGSSLYNVGTRGFYWSSSLYEDGSDGACDLYFASSSSVSGFHYSRRYGQSVRPVTTKLIVPAPKVDDQFVDATSGLKFEVTAVGDTNTVKVIKNNYTGTSYTVPATVSYNDVTFAVTEIGDNAFEGCSSLESVTIPASVTTIGKDAFCDCSSLQSVTLSEGLLTIGESAFEGCSSLESVTIPASVTTIGKDAFYDCSSLQSVTLPEGLLTIGTYAFEGCSALQSITIPASVTEIGSGAFAASGLQTITIPAGVTEIGGSAFSECSSLQSVTLPEGLLTIGEAAFQSCVSLQSITIPAGVTEIGMGAFYECTGLTSVTFLGNACQDAIGEMAFSGVGADAPALLTLHGTWAKENQPDEDGNWYGGKFELSEDPTALPTLFDANANANKFLDNGHLLIRKGDKTYTTLGQEVK